MRCVSLPSGLSSTEIAPLTNQATVDARVVRARLALCKKLHHLSRRSIPSLTTTTPLGLIRLTTASCSSQEFFFPFTHRCSIAVSAKQSSQRESTRKQPTKAGYLNEPGHKTFSLRNNFHQQPQKWSSKSNRFVKQAGTKVRMMFAQ